MHIQLLFWGKTQRSEIRGLLDDYVARIRRFAEVEMRELRPDSAAALRKIAIPAGATVVLLDATGKEFKSEQFAAWLGGLRDRGVRQVVFLCGAAGGIPDALARHASVRMSLSRLTFSHELARAMLTEQIYRGFATLAGHPYPK
jgi:23S rRNA (pseudouridine1915-N3)-methyltransferase